MKTRIKHARTCNVCKSGMNEGYLIEGVISETFCSDKCLHKKYSKKDYNQMFDDDIAFWTTWDPEEK